MPTPVPTSALSLLLLGLLSLAVMPTGSAAADEGRNDPNRRDVVLARVSKEQEAWKRQLPASRPRLFFRAGEVEALRERFRRADGRERQLFDDLLATARKIAAEPPPVYRPPEELVRPPNFTLYAAQEENWMRPIGDNMVALSLAALLVDEPALKEKLRELVLTACAFPQWGLRPKNGDLAAGHVSRGVSIAYDWHPALWSETEKKTIRDTIRERVITLNSKLYIPEGWGGHYQLNHNHVGANGIGLTAVAFFGEIPEAAEWMAAALTNFEKVAKYSNADGSSPEGVPYWSYAASYILQFIEGADPVLGTRRLYDAPFFRNMAAYRLHSSTSGFAGTLTYGDSVPRDYYGPQHFLHRVASHFRDSGAQYLAAALPFKIQGGNDGVAFAALWYDASVPATPPATLDHHQTVADIVTFRSGWTDTDYLVALKSGFTNRNHSHLDAGAITWAFGSEWLINTPGYGSGFGNPAFWQRRGPRWTYFSNATESHATLLIDGENQLFTEEARGTVDAFLSGSRWTWTSVDLREAYRNVKSARRSLLHRRGDYVLVWDQVETPKTAQVEWLAQTPPAGRIDDGRVFIDGKAGSLEIRPLLPADAAFAPRKPTSATIDVGENRIRSSALSQQTQSAEYLVALIPSFSGSSATVASLELAEVKGGRLADIRGSGWRDLVFVPSIGQREPAEASLGSGGLGVAAAGGETFAFQARLAAARFVDGKPDSGVFTSTRKLAVGGWALVFDRPVDLTVQRSAERAAWTLDLAAPVSLAQPPPAGWRLDPAPGAGGRLEAGRHTLVRR